MPVGFMAISIGAASAQDQWLNLPSDPADFSVKDESHCVICTLAFGASSVMKSAVMELLSRSVIGRLTLTVARKVTCGLTSVPDTWIVPV